MKIVSIKIVSKFEVWDELYDSLKLNKDVYYNNNDKQTVRVWLNEENIICCDNCGTVLLYSIYDKNIPIEDFCLIEER